MRGSTDSTIRIGTFLITGEMVVTCDPVGQSERIVRQREREEILVLSIDEGSRGCLFCACSERRKGFGPEVSRSTLVPGLVSASHDKFALQAQLAASIVRRGCLGSISPSVIPHPSFDLRR